jgi:phage terminase large subunit-like protein
LSGSRWSQIADLPEEESRALIEQLGPRGRALLAFDWRIHGRREQLPPDGDWRIWLIMAGRGFGKTRAGAEWVRIIAEGQKDARIALVGASLHEARSVMVEGESGLLNIAPPRHRPRWYPALRRLEWSNGAQAMTFGSAEPESLRGPQFTHAWADELAKWPYAKATWDNLMMGLRLGDNPQVMVTTTPRPVPLVRQLAAYKGVIITRGSTQDNRANLPASFIAAMEQDYGQSRLGRQELNGELIDELEGALWSRTLIESCRIRWNEAPNFDRVVVAVDPPAGTQGDACGIIVAALGTDGRSYILADASVEHVSPESWARAVADVAQLYDADRVVAEANNGGAMVASVLNAAQADLPVRLVHASRGKSARAEPVAALYERGRVKHLDAFAALEDQMCGLMIGGEYAGPGRSPDRADALVWALTELMLGRADRQSIRTL